MDHREQRWAPPTPPPPVGVVSGPGPDGRARRTAFDAPEPPPIPSGPTAGSTAAALAPGAPSGPATTAGTVAPVEVRAPTDASAISCGGAGKRADTSEAVMLEVDSGTTMPEWAPPTHYALISAGTQPLLLNQVPGDAQVPTPTELPRVSDASLETRPGEEFGTKNNAFDSGYRRFVLVPGSRVVAELPETDAAVHRWQHPRRVALRAAGADVVLASRREFPEWVRQTFVGGGGT